MNRMIFFPEKDCVALFLRQALQQRLQFRVEDAYLLLALLERYLAERMQELYALFVVFKRFYLCQGVLHDYYIGLLEL